MFLVFYFKIFVIFGITASNSPIQNSRTYVDCLSTQSYFKNTFIKDLKPENDDSWRKKMVSAEVSLILLYVPWDEESLVAISIFNEVASSYYNKVYLYAVNCWDYKFYCANFFNESRWPSLRVYFKGKTKIQYNGMWTTFSLGKFIDNILVPLKRIQNDYDFSVIDKQYAQVVTGFFTKSDSKEYRTFVQSSLKWLEIDSYQNVGFAVYLDPTIKTSTLHVRNGNNSHMMQINKKTKVYDVNSFVLRKTNTFFHSNNIREQVKSLATLSLSGPVILLIHHSNNVQKTLCTLKSHHNILCQVSCHKFIRRYEEIFNDSHSTDLFLENFRAKTLTYNAFMGIQTKLYIPNEAFTSCQYENSLLYNRTASFFLINADAFDELLFQLVGNDFKITKKDFVIVIDSKEEAVYKLPNVNIINSFMDNLYGVNLNFQNKYLKSTRISVNKEDRMVPSISDIDTSTFLNMLSLNNSTLVAVMYSSNCPLCTHMLHVLLQVSIRLNVKEVKFVRINTDNNDMPWKYNVESNPALYVFPRNMTMDSRVFPHNVKVNFKNVLMFILLYLDSSQLMIATVNICQQIVLPSMSSKCMKFAQQFFYNEVNQQLISWQIYESKRLHVLEMLQALKAIGNNLLKVY